MPVNPDGDRDVGRWLMISQTEPLHWRFVDNQFLNLWKREALGHINRKLPQQQDKLVDLMLR